MLVSAASAAAAAAALRRGSLRIELIEEVLLGGGVRARKRCVHVKEERGDEEAGF